MTNTPTRISVAEAERSFSEVLDRIRDKGESFVVERDGMPVCEMKPTVRWKTAAEMIEIFRSLPKTDPQFADDIQWARDFMNSQPAYLPGHEPRWDDDEVE